MDNLDNKAQEMCRYAENTDWFDVQFCLGENLVELQLDMAFLTALVVAGAGSLALTTFGLLKTHEKLNLKACSCEAITFSVLLIIAFRAFKQPQPEPEIDLELGVCFLRREVSHVV